MLDSCSIMEEIAKQIQFIIWCSKIGILQGWRIAIWRMQHLWNFPNFLQTFSKFSPNFLLCHQAFSMFAEHSTEVLGMFKFPATLLFWPQIQLLFFPNIHEVVANYSPGSPNARRHCSPMARARSFANVTACRAVPNPACFSPLNIGTLFRCCVLGQDTLPSHASLY